MLVLVVGPSGAGKDTVLGLAAKTLAGNKRFRFVRRVITRPADAGAEDHEAVSETVFAGRSFALQWQAHGLRYGIPADVIEDMAQGVVVIANVSRGVIAMTAERFCVHVIEITASSEILARRLAARGRETAEDVASRLARNIAVPDHIPRHQIVNDGTPEQAAALFIAALDRAAQSVPQV